jgi:lipopolysaccharide transport system ATP-binding protein
MIIVQIKKLGKKYSVSRGRPLFLKSIFKPQACDEIWAFKDIDLEINSGEIVGIIGKNGSGKSTLLKILAGITTPTQGTVAINGRVASLIELGAGFQADLTGRENIYLNGTILGLAKREINRKIDQIIRFADIGNFIDAPVRKYSSGMTVRLGFAVASHLDPEILLLDEVLAVGDAAFQKKCLDKIAEFKKSGRTIIFVSHDLNQVANICERVVWIEDGKIKKNGSSREVVNSYLGSVSEAFDAELTVMSRDWPNVSTGPQNQSVSVKKVSVKNKEGKPANKLSTSDSFTIEVEFETKEDNVFCGMTLIFYDTGGNCVFGTIGNRESNWYGKPMPKGRYVSVCRFPANFFNDRWFDVSLNLFGRHFNDSCMTHKILRLQILDGAAVRGDYYGHYDGTIRPLFDWSTDRKS